MVFHPVFCGVKNFLNILWIQILSYQEYWWGDFQYNINLFTQGTNTVIISSLDYLIYSITIEEQCSAIVSDSVNMRLAKKDI